MLEISGRDNSVKDLLNKYLTTETEGLRVKLKELSHMKEMKKISEQEFNANALAILQIISKNTTCYITSSYIINYSPFYSFIIYI